MLGEIFTSNARLRTYTNRLFESILPKLRDELVEIPARKPDIVIVNIVTREVWIFLLKTRYYYYYFYYYYYYYNYKRRRDLVFIGL